LVDLWARTSDHAQDTVRTMSSTQHWALISCLLQA
jgi:hypothetical protein